MHNPLPIILAQAEGAAQPGGGLPGMMMMLVPMIIIWYILLIKPQRKKQKDHEDLTKTLQAGDKIITLGGIHGEVTAVDELTITLKIADKVKVQVNRASIAEKVKPESAVVADGKK